MSPLTKVLIVVLTISSIFLCGVVATYVANAEHYKQKWSEGSNEVQSAKAGEKKAKDDYNKELADKDAKKEEWKKAETALEQEAAGLQAKLDQAEREKSQLLLDVDKWSASVKDLQVTNDKWQGLLENTQTELRKVQAQLTKLESRNKEITTALLEKMAIIAQLEDQGKQLLKEKTKLQTTLQQLLQQFGRTVAYTAPPAGPVRREKVQVASPPSALVSKDIKDIGLKGLITQVDLKNSLAEISIGAADGVKEKMKFYATRGNKFVCEILILDVDAERAVGFIELVQTPPKIGDNISTNIGQ